MLLKNTRGYFYFGVGSLFLVLIVGFVVIDMVMPELGGIISSSLKELFGSVRG